ncbi:MAG: hypothetical protein EPN43_14555 [Jatrophihabitans sp.]|nr:MAG: hypothetical protein EPN43_14555 [Jatrophihabitans sp.]
MTRCARRRRGPAAALAALLVGTALSACSGSSDSASVSVFSVEPGQCFQAPSTVQAELSSLTRVPCSKPHTREAYANVGYAAPDGSSGGAYPGSDALTAFANGACAQRYAGYVGVDYLDSSLFFTFLFPSARSWQSDDDRKIICFVTTTGAKLTASVKGSKK